MNDECDAARLDRATARLEAAQREKHNAVCAFLEAQMATRSECDAGMLFDPLDEATHMLTLARQMYCDALHSHHCAETLLKSARDAYRAAQERFDCLSVVAVRHEMK